MAGVYENKITASLNLMRMMFDKVKEAQDDPSDPLRLQLIQSFAQELTGTREKFENSIVELDSYLAKGKQPSKSDKVKEQQEFMLAYFSFISIYNQLFPESLLFKPCERIVLPPSPVPTSLPGSSKIVLPPIELPSFGGNISERPEFYDLFHHLVECNNEYPDIVKFTILKSHLHDEALSLVKNLTYGKADFPAAIYALKARYNNPKVICNFHLDKLVHFPSIVKHSPTHLRKLLTTINEHLGALRLQNLPVDQWDTLLIFIVIHKLDPSSKRQWEIISQDNAFPTMNEFLHFLEKRCQIEEALTPSGVGIGHGKLPTYTDKSRQRGVHSFVVGSKGAAGSKLPPQEHRDKRTDGNTSGSSRLCVNCKQPHTLYRCEPFLKLTPVERFEFVKHKQLCLNCLSGSHKASSCSSVLTCRHCNSKHHSLLHFENCTMKARPNVEVTPPNVEEEEAAYRPTACTASTVSSAASTSLKSMVLLSTALLHVTDASRNIQEVRFLVDSASQANFITESCFKRLGLSRHRLRGSVNGIGESPLPIHGTTSLTLQPRFLDKPRFQVSALIVDKITDQLPTVQILPKTWPHLEGLTLADDHFYQPGEVDGLVGAEFYPYIVDGRRIFGQPNTPVALSSCFGWLLMGKTSLTQSTVPKTFCASLDPHLDRVLQQFWFLEEVPTEKPIYSHEETRCEAIFRQSVKRESSGQYSVALPFQHGPCDLGDSKSKAEKRYYTLEKRLECNPEMHKEYHAFMEDYLDQKHMSLSPSTDSKSLSYYIPHHCVLKPESTTTKLRVVFDASSKSTSGLSLNDALLTGPKLQLDYL